MEDKVQQLTAVYRQHFRKPFIRFLYILVYAAVGYFSVHQWFKWNVRQAVLQEERMKVTCPTLLSIARTSRDTLLVMRSEQLCIKYVLTTLK